MERNEDPNNEPTRMADFTGATGDDDAAPTQLADLTGAAEAAAETRMADLSGAADAAETQLADFSAATAAAPPVGGSGGNAYSEETDAADYYTERREPVAAEPAPAPAAEPEPEAVPAPWYLRTPALIAWGVVTALLIVVLIWGITKLMSRGGDDNAPAETTTSTVHVTESASATEHSEAPAAPVEQHPDEPNPEPAPESEPPAETSEAPATTEAPTSTVTTTVAPTTTTAAPTTTVEPSTTTVTVTSEAPAPTEAPTEAPSSAAEPSAPANAPHLPGEIQIPLPPGL